MNGEYYKKIGELRLLKKGMNESLRKKHRKLLKFCDIIAFFCILMNFSAVFMTNYLVMQEEPTVEILESNPVMAEVGNYETNTQVRSLFFTLIFNMALWTLIIAVYIYERLFMYRTWHLGLFVTFVMFYFSLLGFDFFNNLGFFIGRLVYG